MQEAERGSSQLWLPLYRFRSTGLSLFYFLMTLPPSSNFPKQHHVMSHNVTR